MHESAIMGFAARSLVTACMMPASVIKTRYESGRYSYGTLLQAGRETLTKEGLKGESQADLTPTLTQVTFVCVCLPNRALPWLTGHPTS